MKMTKIEVASAEKKLIKVDTETSRKLSLATGKIIKKGYSPYINLDTMTWWEYNDSTKEFFDTNVSVFTPIDPQVQEQIDYILENIKPFVLNVYEDEDGDIVIGGSNMLDSNEVKY